MACRRHPAPLSATIHTIQATPSQCYTLLNSYKMARPPLLRSHLLQYRRLMVLPLQVLFLAHCYHAVHSAHKSLWIPHDMAQVMTCRSLKRSRSSHSLNSYSAAESQLLLSSRLNHQFPSHFGMPLCRRLHLVTSRTRCPRRRLFNRTRFRVMWPFRRLSTVPIPYPWTLLRRRPHPVPCLSMSLRRWVLAQLPRFLWIRLCRLLYAVRCYMMLPHNHRSRSSSLAVFTRTVLWTAKTLFVSPRHQCKVHMPYFSHRQDLNSQPLRLSLLLIRTCSLHMVRMLTVLPAMPSSRLSVPLKWEHTLYAQLPAPKGVPVPPLTGTHNPVGSNLRTGTGLFPKPRAVVLPMVSFGQPKSNRLGPIATVDSDLMHHQFRLSLLQWNPGPARRNPTNIVSAACGRFHAVILQEASDHVPHISDQFRVYTDKMDLAILLNKDTFEPDPTVLTFKADSTSKSTWGMVLLIVRGLLRRPSLSGTPTVTFCSVHIHNVVAKKRDASTELLQFLHAKMLEHNVDFIGGDFNMSAFSTVSDVFSDPEFSAPGHSCLWGLGALDEQHRECTGFLIMPKRPYEWRVDSHGCYKFDNALLGFGPRDQSAHLPVFLHLRNTNLPGPSSIMRSDQAQQRRFERKHDKERMQRRRKRT